MKTIIIGAGGHARVIFEILSYDWNIKVVAFIDNRTPTSDEKIMGIPVYGNHLVIPKMMVRNGVKAAIIGVGKNDLRKTYFEGIKDIGVEMINAIHPTANIAQDVKIGRGVVIAANTGISTGVEIGDNVIVNTGAIVEHEDVLESHVHIASGTVIAGKVRVKEGAFIGAGCVVKEYVTIGRNAIVGAGSVVLEDIPDNTVAVGAPAKVIKTTGDKQMGTEI
jgi:sugar O-acyltransferase (sialic acid O-acetyltransferase NeuD family)